VHFVWRIPHQETADHQKKVSNCMYLTLMRITRCMHFVWTTSHHARICTNHDLNKYHCQIIMF
jgi:hypothetical protein